MRIVLVFLFLLVGLSSKAQCSTTYPSYQDACTSFTWEGNTYTSSGAYTATYIDVFGCDSVLVLNLTITSNPVLTLYCGLTTLQVTDNLNIFPYVGGSTASNSYTFNWTEPSNPTWSSSDKVLFNTDLGNPTNQLIPGNYVYHLQISNPSTGCISNTATMNITVL